MNCENLLLLRQIRNITSVDLCNATGIGLNNYSLAERGKVSPKLETLVKIADFYKMEITELVKILNFNPERLRGYLFGELKRLEDVD